MKYNLGDSDNKDEMLNKMVEAIRLHSDNLLNKDHEEVAVFITHVTEMFLDLIDHVEDDQIASSLTQLAGSVIGGMGQAILQLREENDMLKHDILYKLQGDIDPELN